MKRLAAGCVLLAVGPAAWLSSCRPRPVQLSSAERTAVTASVDSATRAFADAQRARDGARALEHIASDFFMYADGRRLGYDSVAATVLRSYAAVRHYEPGFSNIEVIVLARDAAIASFQFRDSIVDLDGGTRRFRGATTLAWGLRGREWKILYADADHYTDPAAEAGPVAARAGEAGDRIALERLVEAVQDADYRGDLVQLRALAAELHGYTGQPALAKAAYYWIGFAHWRLALNTLNEGASADSVDTGFARAIDAFRAALRIDPADVEARIGLASGLGNRAYFHRQSVEEAAPFLAEYVPLLGEIERAAPDNARMIFVVAAAYFHAPADRGRNRAKALAMLERGIVLAEATRGAGADVLEPAWGEAELHMLLAYLVHSLTPRDPARAMHHAREALALRPHWHYVRDILIPQIESKRGQ
jgi:ketosteroid isomerase-like protein